MTKRHEDPEAAAKPVPASLERDELAKLIGARAKVARQRVKLTQLDVAERMGLASEVYGRLERGKMLPSVETLYKLVLVLGLSADELLGLRREDGTSLRQAPAAEASPELRRLLRRARTLDPAQLRLLATIAGVLEKVDK